MSNFWHWYVIILTLGVTAALVWLFIATQRMRIAQSAEDETTGHVWDDDLREYNHPMPRWWLWMFYISVIFSLGYLVLYPGLGRFEGVLGWSQEGQHAAEISHASNAFENAYGELVQQPLETLVGNPQVLAAGRNLFAHNCATCHGSDARGAQGYPNLTDDHWIWGDTPERVLESIQMGRMANMPPHGPMLDEDAVTAVATYVQQLAGKQVDTALASAGKTSFDQICMACHGLDGTGNIFLGAPDLTAGVYIYGSDLNSIRTTIRDGRMGEMPPQLALLGETRTRMLAAYVLSLSQERHAEN